MAAGEGSTTAFGDMTVSTRGSAADQLLVRLHESIHSWRRAIRRHEGRISHGCLPMSWFRGVEPDDVLRTKLLEVGRATAAARGWRWEDPVT
jgi:hypothetical protein